MKVLIIDKDNNSITLLKKIIRTLLPNAIIMTADDGYSGYLLYLHELDKEFDMIITEQYIDGFNGIELTKKLRELNQNLLSYCISSDDVIDNENVFNLILRKPITIKTIREIIV